ncbi:MAG: RNA methyltransferase [Phycisphaerae bacterium]|nr:RNA methyltransferase [Phycisphaerae bacterium]
MSAPSPFFANAFDSDLRGDGLFLAESPRVIRRALHAMHADELGRARMTPRVRPLELLACDAAIEEIGDAVGYFPLVVHRIEHDELTDLTGYRMHDGAIMLCSRPGEPNAKRRKSEDAACADLDAFAAVLPATCTVLAGDGIVHTDNIGSLFRNAACFGDAALLLSERCGDPLHRKAIRIASGRSFTVPWARATMLHQALTELRDRHGFALIAVEDCPGAQPLWEAPMPPRCVFVFGAEGAGVRQATMDVCGMTVHLPMQTQHALREADDVPSLNVAVTSALVLGERRRRQSQSVAGSA